MIIITLFSEIQCHVLCLVSLHVTIRIQCIYEDNIQVKITQCRKIYACEEPFSSEDSASCFA